MLRKLVVQAGSVAGLRIVGTGLSVGVSITIARLFGADVLGVYAFCMALLALAAVPISNGWSSMVLRSVSGVGAVNGDARAMTGLGTKIAVIIAICACAVGWIAVNTARSDVAILIKANAASVIGLLGLTVLCDQISAMRMAAIRGIDKPALAQLPEMLVRPVFLLTGAILGWWLLGPRESEGDLPVIFAALAAAALASLAVGQLILGLITRPEPAIVVSSRQKRAWFVSAAALAGSAGLVQLNGYVDMLLLGSFASASDVGLYRAAMQIAILTSFGYVALNMLAGQRFAYFLAENDKRNLARSATTLARLALLCAAPFPLVIWLAGPQVLGWLFGASFAPSALPALIIALGLCFSASIGMAHALLIMSHEEKLALRLTGVALLINVSLCVTLIPSLGMTGAALANLSASVGWNLLLWFFARRRTGLDTSVLGLSPKY